MAIQTTTLENGMQVLLEENHAAKVVSFNALVKVGSVNEQDEEAGLCHVIEHMLFKGTKDRPAGVIARDVEAAGGEINAYTSIDQTVFYINMAKMFADKGLAILADAIQNSLFDEMELKREKEVILEEIRREQDNPSRMMSEHLFRAAFQKHNYGRPIIGYPKTVKSFTRAQILDFYRRWYTPKNISFIAIGDFDSKKMLEEIKNQFASFNGPKPPASNTQDEPDQTSSRVIVKGMNVQSTYMAIAFHIPGITHQDVPALDVLSHILGGTDSSRLEQEIKEKKQLVHNIYSYSYTPKDPGLFVIGTMLSDKDVPKTIGAVKKEVGKIISDSVTSEELSGAKLNIRSSEIYEKETVGGLASKIAYFMATAGDHEFENRYYQVLGDVRTGTVKKAAEKYLDFNKCTVVLVTPEDSTFIKSQASLKKAASTKNICTKKIVTDSRPVPKKIRLKNGAALIVLENHNLPLVAICASMLGGTRLETKKTNGISGLMSRTMTKGTKTRSALTIARDIEKLAGHLDAFSGRNTIGLKCEFLSEHLRAGFELFSDVLISPAFATDEVNKEKQILLKAIKDQEDQLPSLAFSEFLKTLYPTHPYGFKPLGTLESIKSLTRNDLISYHKNAVRAKNLVLSIVGDVNEAEIVKLANEFLSGLPKGETKFRKIPIDPRPKTKQETFLIKKNKQQSNIVIGFQGSTYKGSDRYVLSVLNNILSGQGGRLFLNLRDRLSLAYAVNSVNQEGIEPGYFAVYIGTDPVKEQKAIEGILCELKAIVTKLVDEEELERSKQYLVGTYELELQRNGTLASIYAFNEIYGIDMKEIETYPQKIMAITREDILKAAKKYITPESYTLAVVKPVS